MKITKEKKKVIIENIKNNLSSFREIEKIIIFGSFLKKNSPNDIDIAIFQDSKEDFLTLSLRYRKVLREIAKIIPLDILPIKKNSNSYILDEIKSGITIYEK